MSPAWGLPKEPDTVTELPPWRASPAHHRAVALGALGAVVAVVLRRPDVLVPRHALSCHRHLGSAGAAGSGPVGCRPGSAISPSRRGRQRPGRRPWTCRPGPRRPLSASPGRFVRVDPSPTGPPSRRPGCRCRAGHPRRVVRWGRRRVGPGWSPRALPGGPSGPRWSSWGRFGSPQSRRQPASTRRSAHTPWACRVNRSVRPGSGAEFATIREFHPGDRLRRIHWPSLLRQGQLHVSTTYADQDAHVVLVVDAFSDPARGRGHRRTPDEPGPHRAGLRLDRPALPRLGRPGVAAGTRCAGPAAATHRLRTRAAPADPDILPASNRPPTGTARRSGPRGVPSDSLVIVPSPLVHPAMSGVVAAASARGLTTVVIDTSPTTWSPHRPPGMTPLAWRLRILERDEELHSRCARRRPDRHLGWTRQHRPVLRDVARRDRQPRLARR